MWRHIYSIVFEHLAEWELLYCPMGVLPWEIQLQLLCQLFTRSSNSWKTAPMLPLSFSICVKHLTVFPIFLFCISLKILDWTNTFCSGLPRTYATDSNMLWWIVPHLVLYLCCLVFHRVQFWGPYCFLSMFPLWQSLMDPSWQCTQMTSSSTNQSVTLSLQADIDAIQDCISTNYLTLNPHKCKYLFKKDTPPSASNWTPIRGCNIRAGWKLSLSRRIGDIKAILVWPYRTNMY